MLLRTEDIYADILEEDWSDYEDPEYEYDPEVGKDFVKDLVPILNELIQDGCTINEEFTTNSGLVKHFKEHCLGSNTSKKSSRHRVYYDFEKVSQYKQYDKDISSDIAASKDEITTLYDYDLVIRYLRKLFCGNMIVKFTTSCGLYNNGEISMSLIAFSSNVTTNYKAANTIDICIKNDMKRTITLYPVDANYLQTRFNAVIKKYGTAQNVGDFEFNND